MGSHSVVDRYEDTVFISYTHIDNEPFGPEHLHWISIFHEQLSNRLGQLFGGPVTVWRDKKLTGSDILEEALVERLSNVAVLVSVISPRYLHSDWCQLELDTFLRSARAGQGVQVGTKSRVFKVVKTPVPQQELPGPLVSLLGYEFYEMVPGESRVREFLLNPPTEQWKFYARIDDLAYDIAELLGDLAVTDGEAAPSPKGKTLYLAEATSDMTQYRDNVKREFERQGHRVLPQRALPLEPGELTTAATADLSQAQLSIHLLGTRYGARPESEERSIPHLQVDLARELATGDRLVQLIWIPEELDPIEEKQRSLVEVLQEANVGAEVEVVRASFESFKDHVRDRISASVATRSAPATVDEGKRVYLVHDRDDREPARAVKKQLEAVGHSVIVPLAKGTESEAREAHEASMVWSDAVLIYYGNATEHWLRMKLFDLLKAPGWGRTEPFQAKAVWMAAPSTPHKATYSTNEALVIDATGGLEPSTLARFLAQLDNEALTS